MHRLAAALAALLIAVPVAAQTDSAPPRIRTVAHGRVLVPADAAVLSLRVETHGPTAEKAAASNADAQSSLRALLRGAGVEDRDFTTIGYIVTVDRDEYRTDDRAVRPKLPPAYTADCEVTLRVHDLSRLGRLVDVAVSVSGTLVYGISFETTRPDSAHAAALDAAVRAAHADAETIARSLGGRLGTVASVETNVVRSMEGGRFNAPQSPFGRASTAFAPPPVAVEVEVVASWAFVRAP